jgi:hypothetical protein
MHKSFSVHRSFFSVSAMSPEAAQYTENLIAAQGADIDPESSPLDAHLTAEQRAKIFAWIEDREEDLTSSVKRIFAEFGVKVSKIAVRAFYQKRKIAIARINLREQAEAAKEVIMAGADADTVEDAVIATLITPWKSSPRIKSPPAFTAKSSASSSACANKRSAWNAFGSNALASNSTSPNSS